MKNNQNEKIKDILDDLYAIDPVFEQYEEEVKKTIKELLKSKPDIKIDQAFIAELREKLIKRAEELQRQPQKKIVSFWQSFFGLKFAYAFSGVLIFILFMGIVFHFTNPAKTPLTLPGLGQKVSLGENAFGSLKNESGQALSIADEERGTGTGGGFGGNGIQVTAEFDSASKAICMGEGCVVPPYYSPKYIYKGDEIKLEQDKIEVLRKMNKTEYARSFAGLLDSFGFGLADLARFDNARIQTINLVQEKEFGYSIFINLDEGMISIDAYWPKWPQNISRCIDERCVMENSLSLSDVPSDEELINIASRFISEHRINLSNYGEPEIDKNWNQVYYDQPRVFVPDVISIKYPLLINGKLVYEQGGGKLGIGIGINIRHKRVAGVYNLSVQEYESSLYEAETDFAKILKAMEKGGLYNYPVISEESKEVEVGTPESAYAVIWKYDESAQTSRTLLVPALVFPVKMDQEAANTYGYNEKIVIPLAKELLESVDYPIPMPLMEKDPVIE